MARKSGIVWRPGQSPKVLSKKIALLGSGIDAQVLAVASVVADETATWMKANHRWVNRTGEAEAKLQASAVQLAQHLIAVYIVQGAPHGIWLELRWGGRYGIIPDALMYAYPRIMDQLRGVLGSTK